MSDRTWHSGPPPHVGWWLCGFDGGQWVSAQIWRWWNGEEWSVAVRDNEGPSKAAYCAHVITWHLHVKWSDYYPENARVPRIDPAAAAIKQYLATSIVMPAKKAGK